MQRRFVLAFATIILQAFCLTTVAHAQESDIDCNSFIKNADGSWTVIQKVYIPVQQIRINEGVTFTSDQLFLGIDMVARLNKACPNVKPQPADTDASLSNASPSVPGASQAPQAPHLQLSQYADASGDLDIRRLTCAHLEVAAPDEADLLLSWYSGWYAANAKKRGINLTRVRYAMRNVMTYCRSNGDKTLSQVMELMLK
jgi:hypothetical protein